MELTCDGLVSRPGFSQFEPQLFLNSSCFHHVSYRRKHVGNPNRVLLAAGRKFSVLKHSFAQEILVTLLQHPKPAMGEGLGVFTPSPHLFENYRATVFSAPSLWVTSQPTPPPPLPHFQSSSVVPDIVLSFSIKTCSYICMKPGLQCS